MCCKTKVLYQLHACRNQTAQPQLLESLSSPTVSSGFICWKWSDLIDLDFLWEFSFCPVTFICVFVPVASQFSCCLLYSIVLRQEGNSDALIYFPVLVWTPVFPYAFQNCFFKISNMRILTGIPLCMYDILA